MVHSHSRSVIPYGITEEALRPVVHSCATIGTDIPVWDAQTGFGDTNLLVSSMAMGRDFASVLKGNSAALMRGHGCTVVGRSIREAVYTAVYLTVNADLQMQASRFPPVKVMTGLGNIGAAAPRSEAVSSRTVRDDGLQASAERSARRCS